MARGRLKTPCPETGKNRYRTSLDLILHYSHARKLTRPYLCPFCNYWHASSKPLKTQRRDAA